MRRHTEVPHVKISESDLKIWIRGMLYKSILGKKPKSLRFRKVTINFIWRFKFWLDSVKVEVTRRLSEGNVNVIIF
jgi:hypothetical protein